MCGKMFIVTLFVMTVYFAFGKSTVMLEIVGQGLVLVNASSIEKIYEHKFYEPKSLDMTCTLEGAFGVYDFILMNETAYVGKRVTLPSSSVITGSISHTFKLTPESKTISCFARDVATGLSSFKSRVLLKYEEREATAPSTPTTDTPELHGQPGGRPAPTIRNDISSQTRVDAATESTGPMTPPPAHVMPDVSSSNFWTPSTSVIFTLAGIALVLIGLLICVALHYRKRANRNKIPDDIINRPPLDLPSDIIYEEVYSHCRAFRNRGNETKKHVLPINGLENIKRHQIAIPTSTAVKQAY